MDFKTLRKLYYNVEQKEQGTATDTTRRNMDYSYTAATLDRGEP